MDMKTFLAALAGGLVAAMVGPVLWAGIEFLVNGVMDAMESRKIARESEEATRKAVAIVNAMRRNPGKKWEYHSPEGFNKHKNEGGEDELYV